VANPVAAIISAALMCEFLGEDDAAARIHKACADPERYAGTTSEVGDAIVAAL
jgi:3-isopropylmalate dehydrogenase